VRYVGRLIRLAFLAPDIVDAIVEGRQPANLTPEAVTRHIEIALLRALSRGYQWFGELASGRVASTKQLAAREGLSHSYVRHVVPLGLLAPKVIEAICAGQQSVTVSAERLKDHTRLPIEWDAQQRLLSD
jgi:hypothetical protein